MNSRPANFLAIWFIILVLLAACTSQTPSAASRLSVRATTTHTLPHPIASLTPTARLMENTPTKTHTITQTPSPTAAPTLTPYPTFAPATVQADAGSYQLAAWSAQSAEELVSLAENSIPPEPSEYRADQYEQYSNDLGDATAAISVAYQEAMLRAPTSPSNDAWQRQLIYSQAANGYVDADRFNRYLTDKLSTGEVSFNNLENWLAQYFTQLPNFSLPPTDSFAFKPTVTEVRLAAAFTEGYLLHFSNGWMGAICSVIAKDQAGYHSYPLVNSFYFDVTPNAVHQEIDCHIADLTGDGIDEVIIVSEWGARLVNQKFEVHSLDQWPPRRLLIDPEIARTNGDVWPSRYYFREIVFDDLPNRLKLWLWPSVYDCSIYADSYYRWNGLWLAQTQYGPADGDNYADPRCSEFLDLLLTPQKLRPILLERFLKAQPGSDSLRYHLGIQWALLGDFTQSVQILEELLAAPTDPQGEWVQNARRFLTAYTSADQIYTACGSVPDCAPGEGLTALARQLPPEKLTRSAEYLKDAGVPVLKSGRLPDSEAIWLTVRWPGSANPELWLLETDSSELAAAFVSELTGNFSAPSKIEGGASNGFNLYKAGNILFLYAAAPDGGLPYVQRIFENNIEPENDHQRFERLSDQLLKGGDPSLLLAEMKALHQNMTLNASELYKYGLAAELAGQADEANRTYWQLWKEFPDSVFANLARYKLVW